MSQEETWTIGRLLNWTKDFLQQRGAESPRLDAEVLLAHARGCKRIELYTAFEEEAPQELRDAFRELVRRRAAGTPVAYLVKMREFYSLEFEVTPDVLIPRPETELIVVGVTDHAKQTAHSAGPLAVADVGTGSGILAVCLAKRLKDSRVTALDISPKALAVAKRNAERHGVTDRIAFLESDLFAAAPSDARFDYVVSNPPYITTAEMATLPAHVLNHEPRLALDGGAEGTTVIERLLPEAAARLKPGGRLFMEISPMLAGRVESLLRRTPGLAPEEMILDLERRPRIATARNTVEDQMSPAPWISLVALGDEEVPSPDAVARCLAEAFPDAAPLKVSGSTPRAATFDWGNATANYTLVDRPIPWSQIEGPCVTAWYWPEAQSVMRRHTAHLFVTLLSEIRDPIDRSMRLTQLVSAVSEAADAEGIVWGPSSLVHSPAAFRTLAVTMTPDDLPLHLWIDFRVSELDDGAFALFTTGMEALGSRELEVNRFAGEPHVLAGYVYNIAHYLLEKKPQLKEGEAIGLPDGAQASIRFEPSLVDPDQEAVRLDFDS